MDAIFKITKVKLKTGGDIILEASGGNCNILSSASRTQLV